MNIDLHRQYLDRSRRKSLELLDAIASRPDPAAVLGWRPAPGRAHIAWQLLHVAATDDRHVHVRMKSGDARDPEMVRRFAGGSVPDDNIPTVETIRRYMEDRRRELLEVLGSLTEADLANKPNEKAPFAYGEWFQVLAWHEAHHHGQAHLTYNLYRAAHDQAAPKVGH
jgi:hypothetical protein